MNIYNNFLGSFKSSYMLMIPLSIVFQSCLGSISAMYILMDKGSFMMWQLALVVMTTMIYNAAILAQLKVEIVFKLLLLSLVVNLLILMTVLV